jgi:hypothetical protein
MKPTEARQLLVSIAREDVGKHEVSRNRAPWIEKLWPATNYPEAYDLKEKPYYGRAPYCAAGMCYVLKTFIERLRSAGELVATLGMTGAKAERWRCKSAGAYAWMDWAKKNGVLALPDTAIALPGDFIVFDFSHIGMVEKDSGGLTVNTIEYNTNDSGSRDGDGCLAKVRRRKDSQIFIRVIPE